MSKPHAILVWVYEDGRPQWDHRDDLRLADELTEAQRDTLDMVYAGYKSAKHAHQMQQDARKRASQKRTKKLLEVV